MFLRETNRDFVDFVIDQDDEDMVEVLAGIHGVHDALVEEGRLPTLQKILKQINTKFEELYREVVQLRAQQ